MVVAYDGTDFSGFAAQPSQPHVRTVGGVLGQAIGKVLRHDGRARRARAAPTRACTRGARSCRSRRSPGSIRGGWRRRSRRCSGPRSSCGRASSSTPRFDARHSATWRQYRYTIVNRPVPDPFRDRFTWWVPEPLDLRALWLAADPFVGEHDFASFCRKGPEGSTTMRTVLESSWVDEGDGVLRYEIRAAAFCWQMVRVDRRHARRGRRGQAPAGRDARHHRARAIARLPGSSPRRAACASGTSATDRDRRGSLALVSGVDHGRRWRSSAGSSSVGTSVGVTGGSKSASRRLADFGRDRGCRTGVAVAC